MNDSPRETAAETSARRGVSRRRMLTTAVGSAAVGALAGVGGTLASAMDSTGAPPASPPPGARTVPFYGERQAGIQTPSQDHLVFMTFDVSTNSASDLQLVLAKWSAAMAQLTMGRPVGATDPNRSEAVPVDTGEADGLGPAGLTLTLGFGPGLFDDNRFGLGRHRPALLQPIPTLPGDSDIAPQTSGGDLCVQACADDPQVAYHAVRNLARLGRPYVTTRWMVIGFGRASAGAGQQTPRNLMGFKDGTRNISTDEDFQRWVWVSDTDQQWLRGGSYLVARKIHINIETWDQDTIGDQEAVFGRNKTEGAPLNATHEKDTPDFAAKNVTGSMLIPPDSHVALAASENNGGVKILRRSYNYTDGIDNVGQLDAGLMFLAYCRDPGQFVQLQSKLGASDRLNEYIKHLGSALFAVPPGLSGPGDYFGKSFFAA